MTSTEKLSPDFPYAAILGGLPKDYDPTTQKLVVLRDGAMFAELSQDATMLYRFDGKAFGPAMYEDRLRRRLAHIVGGDDFSPFRVVAHKRVA